MTRLPDEIMARVERYRQEQQRLAQMFEKCEAGQMGYEKADEFAADLGEFARDLLDTVLDHLQCELPAPTPGHEYWLTSQPVLPVKASPTTREWLDKAEAGIAEIIALMKESGEPVPDAVQQAWDEVQRHRQCEWTTVQPDMDGVRAEMGCMKRATEERVDFGDTYRFCEFHARQFDADLAGELAEGSDS